MFKKRFFLWIVFCFVSAGLAAAPQQQTQPQPTQQQPQLQEEVTVRWWLVPVYAVNKAGAPVLNLAPEDLGIYIKGLKVEQFSLIKKRFQASEARKPASAARAEAQAQAAAPAQASAPAQKKMVFLVFDAAFSPYTLLARAKSIADTVIAQSDQSAQYVLLSIEPFSGLKHIFGPSRDLKQLSKNMRKYVEGKKADYLMETSAMDKREINQAYPEGDTRNPGTRAVVGRSTTGGSRSYTTTDSPFDQDIQARIDWKDKRRVAASYASGLMTLDLVVERFRDYSKVVYLYSCGIPGDALLDRTEFGQYGAGAQQPASATQGMRNTVPPLSVFLTPDTIAYDSLKTVGEHLNKSGALLFLVNPAGTRIDETNKDSGEQSLRILADESGGRYFEGAAKDISQQVNNMEGGYYEISFPDKPEYGGQELSFEIRSNKPDVQIFTVKKVGREKSFADMTELEKESSIMNIVNEGPFAEEGLKVSSVPGEAIQEGDELFCQIMLPKEIARSEWTIFKIAKNLTTGRILLEKESVVPIVASVQVKMKWRGKDWRHDIVLAHPKTGTILVWK